MDWIKSNWLLVIVAAVAFYGLYSRPDPVGKVVVATPAPEVAKVEKVSVPVKKVQVYAGGAKLKQKLTLPKPVVDNDKEQIIASSKIAPSDNPHTVTTIINTDTGASETYVRTDPLPWLAVRSTGGVGMYYGMKNGEQAVRVQVRQDFVQVKAVRLGAIASVDLVAGRVDTFAGIGGEYRW